MLDKLWSNNFCSFEVSTSLFTSLGKTCFLNQLQPTIKILLGRYFTQIASISNNCKWYIYIYLLNPACKSCFEVPRKVLLSWIKNFQFRIMAWEECVQLTSRPGTSSVSWLIISCNFQNYGFKRILYILDMVTNSPPFLLAIRASVGVNEFEHD